MGMKFVAVVACVLLCGCATIRVEPLSLLQGETSALAFRDRTAAGTEVSVAGLPEILARATWVSRQVYHKGGIWVRFNGGREVFLPYGFEFYLIAGVPGHFEIRSEDAERYRALTQRIQKEANTASEARPRPSTPPASPGAAQSTGAPRL